MATTFLRGYCALGILLGIACVLSPAGAYAQEDPLPKPFLYDKLEETNRPLVDTESVAPPEPLQLLPAQETAEDRVESKFIGNWRLISFERFDAEGVATTVPMIGRIMYDADGNMAAQLMPEASGDDERVRRYYAYFGAFELDIKDSRVTHHVESSNLRAWVGTELVRHFRFQDNDLILELRDGERVTSRLTWRKLS